MTKRYEELQKLINASGVKRSALISSADIVVNSVFRDVCAQNSCGCYGRCYMCPPDVGPIEELMQQFSRYDRGILYQTVYPLEDSFDFEGMMDAKKAHHACARKIHAALLQAGYSDFLHLEAGGCGVCERCAKLDDLPCRAPEKALPSLEAYGVDVYQTASKVDLPYINGQNTVTYFGLVLLKEKDNA